MAIYLDPETDAALLNPDVRNHPEVQTYVDRAERQILAVYSRREPGDCLDMGRNGFEGAMRDAVAAQAHYLWQERDSGVASESAAGRSYTYRPYTRLCAEARDALRPYDVTPRTGIPLIDR